MRSSRVWWVLGVLVLVTLACAPKRLKNLAQKPDDRDEAQLRAGRHLKNAQTLFDRGDGGGAQQEFLAALREDPMLYKAHMGLADIYELEGDKLATLVENVAHTELAPKVRHYLDRMFPYVFAKFSRNPAGPEESGDKKRSQAMLVLSEAVDLYRQGKLEAVFSKLEQAKAGLPRAGLIEYFAGSIKLRQGKQSQAARDFEQAVFYNPYFARRLLIDAVEKQIPDLLMRLQKVLENDLKKHPADMDSAILLSAIHLRRKKFKEAIEVARTALGWSSPRWEILLIKAAAHQKLGQAALQDQALSDMFQVRGDLSMLFNTYEPSFFQGILAGEVDELAGQSLSAVQKEPARSYFLWRFYAEKKDARAQKSKQAFLDNLQKTYPPDQFSDLPSTSEPEVKPNGLLEFMGAVQEQVNEAMPAFQRCDRSRRSKRGNPSGRVTLRVLLSRDGSVAQAGVEENSTGDDYLAYCLIRKLIDMRFPEPLRATESFKIPVLFGPEADSGS
ncbi:MAG: tetratricopeptide repeat protein [Deltaproteobacteria bacterium]|nr:tetratricopeptide repeat protein [Deltaproteobacteria bacterium]